MRIGSILLLVLVACKEDTHTPFPSGRDDWPKELVFGVAPYYTEPLLRAEHGRLVEHFARELAMPATLRVTESYGDLSSQLSRNLVHIAVFSPFNYVRARTEIPNLVLLAIPITRGSASYESLIITHEDTGITAIDQLRGRHFGFVERRSASGFLYPTAYLISLGHAPEQFFGSMEFAGSHDTLFAMVVSGEVAAGATFVPDKKELPARRVRVLATTGRIPQNAYCANPTMPTTLTDAVRRVLLGLRGEEALSVFGSAAISGFSRVDDTNYDEVRRVARLVRRSKGP